MSSDGKFGAVACLRDVRNPILVAQAVHSTPHNLLAGPGAVGFARALGHAAPQPPEAPVQQVVAARSDTVAVLATDGQSYAAAASSGGMLNAAVGRVGDVALIGCGLFVGSAGAVAVTGDGEQVIRRLLARRLYLMLQAGHDPSRVAEEGVQLLSPADAGTLVLQEGHPHAASSAGMAWAVAMD